MTMFTIFEKLGGVNAAFDIIQKRTEVRPSLRALKHWRLVRTLPSKIIVELMQEALERNIPVAPGDFHLPGYEDRKKAS